MALPAGETVLLKVKLAEPSLPDLLATAAQARRIPVVATGLSSVWRYATMQRGPVLSVYCPEAQALAARLPATGSERFPNLEPIETQDATAYFGAVDAQGFGWAAPIQVFLELTHGDRRDQDTAEQVRAFLLSQFHQAQPWSPCRTGAPPRLTCSMSSRRRRPQGQIRVPRPAGTNSLGLAAAAHHPSVSANTGR